MTWIISSVTAPPPAATLYSALIREVAKKGKDARFRRADVKETKDGKAVRQRGYFELTDAGKKG